MTSEAFTVCTRCGHLDGRPAWQWQDVNLDSDDLLCENCAHDRVVNDEEEEQRKYLARIRDRRLRFSGIPEAARRALDDLDDQAARGAALSSARALVAGDIPALLLVRAPYAGPIYDIPNAAPFTGARSHALFVLLVGPVGTGKTSIAAATATDLTRRMGVKWVSVPALVVRLEARFGSETRADAIEIIDGDGALVLDDLDKAKPSEQTAMHLFAAIDARIAAGAPLIATSNLRPGELAARWPQPHGEAMVSRLTAGATHLIEGHDRRRPARGTA